jgi:hypothetical protein
MGFTYNQYIDTAWANIIPATKDIGTPSPLDIRCVVDTYDDLVNFIVFKSQNGNVNWYAGMIVYCVERNKLYTLQRKSNIGGTYNPGVPSHHEWVEVGGISPEDLSGITDSIAALNNSVQGIQSGMSITGVTSEGNSYKKITLRVDDPTTDVDENISIDVYDINQVYNKTQIDTGLGGKLNNSSYLTKTDIYGILGFDQIIFSMVIDGATYSADTTMTWNNNTTITDFIGKDIDDKYVTGFDVYYTTDLEEEKPLESITNVKFSKFIVNETRPLYIKFYIKKDSMKSNSIKISFK